MQRGIALLNENTTGSLTEAVGFFDRALAIRRAVIEPGDHWQAYLTAASWMNRGDALTRLAQIAGAVRSYDEALTLMRAVPLEADPLYRRRLAIAWMNRGISLHQQGTAAAWAEAVQSFERGIEVVREHPEHSSLLACAWMNRGNALLRTAPPQSAEARASAVAALDILVATEERDLLAAETALKARYIICQAIAELLAEKPATDGAADLISAATDAVEEGMRLARDWEKRGETSFRSLLGDFFRFGVAIYREHQSRFLAEFVLENLDPARSPTSLPENREMYVLAARALTAVADELRTDGFAAVNTPRFDRHLETLRARQWIEERLRTLGTRGVDII
jgi:hypothetical protein